MVDMHDFIQIMRREAMNVVQQYQKPATLVATSYNPDTHSVKGMIVPAMVESGWVPLTSLHAGDGYGIMVGPNVGSAEKLDGDVFDLHFENGDPNTPIAKHKHFSASDNPPRVEAGEMLLKHQTGGSVHFKADGSIVTTHKDGGQSVWDRDGNHAIDTKGKNVTIDSGTGSQTFMAKSQSFAADTVTIKGKVTVDGDLDATGSVKAAGSVTGSNGALGNGMALTPR